MDNVTGKWALVTGASSGLGLEFATLLAQKGANLVLVARRKEPMERLAERIRNEHRVEVLVEPLDLSAPSAAAQLKSRMNAKHILIDVLVNNAGFGLYGQFLDQPVEHVREMLQLNMIAVTEMAHVFGTEMKSRGKGHILFIASLLAYQATPGYAAYAASKAYVLLLGEALNAELKKHGVAVTVLSPGPTATSFAEVAGQRDTSMIRILMMDPRPVAHIGVDSMLRRRPSVVAGLLNKLIVFGNRVIPRSVQRQIMQSAVRG
jgi:short-subunit dehydrogenase